MGGASRPLVPRSGSRWAVRCGRSWSSGSPSSGIPGGCWSRQRLPGPLQGDCKSTATGGGDGGVTRLGRSTACAHGSPTSRGTSTARGCGSATRRSTTRPTGGPTIVFVPIDPIVHSRAWKGAGALPRPALPGGHHRPARQRPLGPADRGRGVRRRGVRRRHDRRDGPPRHRPGRAGRALRQRLALADRRRRCTPIGSRAWSAIAPWVKDATPPLAYRAEAIARFDDELDPTRAGTRPTGTSGATTGRSTPSSSSARCSPSRTRPSSARTWSASPARPPPRRCCWSTTPPAGPTPSRRPRPCCAASPHPVLVVQGTADRCQPQERMANLAELTGAEHLVLEGAGHLPMARYPVAVNRAVKQFVDRVTGAPDRRGARSRGTRVGRGRSTSARRSVWATYAATWRSPTRCASSGPTWRCSG